MHSLIASYTRSNFFTLFRRDETTRKTHKDYFLYFCKLWQLSEIIKSNNTCHVAAQNIIEWITCLFSWDSILSGEYQRRIAEKIRIVWSTEANFPITEFSKVLVKSNYIY